MKMSRPRWGRVCLGLRAVGDSRSDRSTSTRGRLLLAGGSALLFLVGTAACRPLTAAGPAASEPLASDPSLVNGYPTFPADDPASELFHFVVEIPAGTNDKWEVDKESGRLRWEERGGRRRVVQYLAYPGNYGMIPSTSLPRAIGGDGDPLDVLVLGPAIGRGSVVLARPIGLLRLVDGGERDDKIIAVQASGPLSDARDLATLEARYRGARTIIETWFTNYKGPGRMTSDGFGDAEEARTVIREASRYFAESVATP